MFNVGYFLRFPTCRLDLYHPVPWSALALSLDVTSSWLWSLWYIWWPPANIDMSVDRHRGRSSRSRSLTKEEEEVLQKNRHLGGGTTRALLSTMWWLLTQHFGLRGWQEHYQMEVGDLTLQRDYDGNEILSFAKGPTKTRQGRLSVKTRLVTLKMFATGNEERCPVMLFKRYLETRPSEMKKSGPFHLSVFDEPVSSVWHKKTPVGKNIINTFMNNMKENSALKDLCPEKNLTYHSARKTVVKKLKSSGISKCEIKNITSHASAQGLDDYYTTQETNESSRSFHEPLTTLVLFL